MGNNLQIYKSSDPPDNYIIILVIKRYEITEFSLSLQKENTKQTNERK